MSTENQAHLLGDFRREERLAAGTISPGMLLTIDSDGAVLAHDTEGGLAGRSFAEVDALQGNTLDDDYSADDLVSINIEMPGSECQAFLKAGENVVIGDKLVSAGDGTLIDADSVSSGVTIVQYIAIALEALDLSGSGAVDTLMRVFVL